jgi:hypothetical protein
LGAPTLRVVAAGRWDDPQCGDEKSANQKHRMPLLRLAPSTQNRCFDRRVVASSRSENNVAVSSSVGPDVCSLVAVVPRGRALLLHRYAVSEYRRSEGSVGIPPVPWRRRLSSVVSPLTSRTTWATNLRHRAHTKSQRQVCEVSTHVRVRVAPRASMCHTSVLAANNHASRVRSCGPDDKGAVAHACLEPLPARCTSAPAPAAGRRGRAAPARIG